MNIFKKQCVLLIFVAFFDFCNSDFIYGQNNTSQCYLFSSIKEDYINFYSGRNLFRMGFAFSVGGVIAHTPIDENIQDWYQDHVRNSCTNKIAKGFKVFGEGKYLVPVTLLSAGFKYCLPKNKITSIIGTWGANSARAYLVGGPAVLLLQRITGASRPGETRYGSQWRPLSDDNGVSGHAFIGAVPFLTIARMIKTNIFIKQLFYGISVFTALSRINDNRHFFSQAALGWFLAWQSTSIVVAHEKDTSMFTINPLIGYDSYGLCIRIRI